MPYRLFLDKSEEFVCEMEVKNASLKNAFARMIIESSDLTIMFPGQLKDGKCIVPIKRLKGILSENTTGTMKLEVVVEDTYFSPWSSEYVVEENTSVKVKVQEQRETKKPMVEVKSIQQNLSKKISLPTKELLYICEKLGITKTNFSNRKQDFKQVIKEYFKKSPEFMSERKKYVVETVIALK